MIIAALVLVSLAILLLVSRKSVHSEIIIPALPQEIWKVLMDQNAYPEWNPVLIPVRGKLEKGEGESRAPVKTERRWSANLL